MTKYRIVQMESGTYEIQYFTDYCALENVWRFYSQHRYLWSARRIIKELHREKKRKAVKQVIERFDI